MNSKKHSLLSNPNMPQVQKLNNNPSFPNVNPIQQVNLSLISDEDLALYKKAIEENKEMVVFPSNPSLFPQSIVIQK